MNRRMNPNAFLYILFNLLISFNSGIFNTFAGIYLKEKGYDEAFVGSLLSVNNFSLAVFSLFGAYFIGRFGRKKNFIASALAMAMGMVLLVTADSTVVILTAGVLVGLGLSLKTTGEAMFLSENAGQNERVFVFSMNFTAYNIGWMLASFCGGLLSNLLKRYYPSHTALVLVILSGAAVAVVSALPIFFVQENRRGNMRGLRECFAGYRTVLTENSRVLYFLLFNATIGLGAGMVVPFFSVYLKYSLHIDDATVGSIMAFAQLGCVLGGFLIPILANRLGVHRAVITCQLISIPFLLSIAFPSGIGIVAISFFIRSSLMNMATPLIQNLGMDMVHPLDRANLSGLMTLSNNITRAMGISAGGYIMKHVSYHTPYYFTVFFYLCSVFLFTRIYRDAFHAKKQG